MRVWETEWVLVCSTYVVHNALMHEKNAIYRYLFVEVTLGCVNVPKVIKYMQPKAQTIIWVINDSSVKRNPKIIYFLNCTKPFEVYLVPYVVAVSEKNLFTKKSHLTWFK